MSKVTLDIPDVVLPRVVDAFATRYNYNSKLPDGTNNPITKAQFAKVKIIDFVKTVVRLAEGETVAEAARKTKSDEIDTFDIT